MSPPDPRDSDPGPSETPPRGDLHRLLRGPLDVRSLALTGLFVLAVLVVLKLGRGFFLPIVIGLLFSFLLMPLVRGLVRLRVPQALAAALVVAGALGVVGIGAQALYEPAREWVLQAPAHAEEVERRLRSLRQPLEQVTRATDAVDDLDGEEEVESEVALRPPSFLRSLAVQTTALLGSTIVTVVLLYFLLATGDSFLRKIVEVLPRFRDKRQAVEIMRRIETDVSRYLLTVTAINSALGVVIAVAMAALGMPNPVLWGVMAAVLNFVPVLGAFTGTVVVAGVALLSFDGLAQAAGVPLVFAAITGLEGLVITPAVLGQRFTLSPVIVFVGLFAGSWLWGIPGALVAVPLLVASKILFDRIEALQPLGHLMGR